MKAYIALLSAAAIGLTACGDKPAEQVVEDTATSAANAATDAANTAANAATDAANATAEAANDAVNTATVAADEALAAVDEKCATTVESTDGMKFTTDTLKVNKACPQFVVTLKHTGKLPASSMGHNIVIAKATDVADIAKDGAAAGAAADYIKAGDDRVIAHSDIVGGGEETKFTIDPTKLTDGNYEFFCSFPGHVSVMKGKVELVDF
ncbi:azurin [Moraxella nasovis]|uniref:azurin n=1 Tax=Moraxella nasovis TaxID=2904121 RepID=UPI001F617E55|nr:azurin [Moraxella nasovis]UNU72569.1 azurin [Moraxella nasovis]